MILLLGPTGYIGSQFLREMDKRGLKGRGLPRLLTDYTNPCHLLYELRAIKPKLVINCAALVVKGSVDNNEDFKRATLSANLVFPAVLAAACHSVGAALMHISTGCLYNGDNGGKGFLETSEPQLSFDSECGVYVGAKELAEREVSKYPYSYICRIRLPFDMFDHPRNLLTKLQSFETVVDAVNSITHRGDFASACLDLWHQRAPWGTYNMTNPGAVKFSWICNEIVKNLGRYKGWSFVTPEEFQRGSRTPKSNCVLNTDKLAAAGIKMRPVEEAVIDSLKNWA